MFNEAKDLTEGLETRGCWDNISVVFFEALVFVMLLSQQDLTKQEGIFLRKRQQN